MVDKKVIIDNLLCFIGILPKIFPLHSYPSLKLSGLSGVVSVRRLLPRLLHLTWTNKSTHLSAMFFFIENQFRFWRNIYTGGVKSRNIFKQSCFFYRTNIPGAVSSIDTAAFRIPVDRIDIIRRTAITRSIANPANTYMAIDFLHQ